MHMREQYRVSVAAVITGAALIIIQQQFIRELLALFGGNELIIGILLGTWLLAGAAGSVTAGRIRNHGHPASRFVAAVLTAALLPIPAVTFMPLLPHAAGWPAGMAPGLWHPLFAAAVFMALPAFLGGLVFTTASRLPMGGRTVGAGRMYLLEAAGAGFGGTLYYLAVRNTVPAAVVAVTAGMLLVAAALLASPSMRTYVRVAVCMLLLMFMSVLPARVVPRSGRILLRQDTPYARMQTDVRDGQYTVSVNGTPAVSIPPADMAGDETYLLATLTAHPAPASILVLSGRGLPFAAAAAVAAGTTVTLAEPVPGMVAHQRRVLPDSLAAYFDANVHTIAGDARRFIAAAPQHGYDIVFLDLPPATDLLGNRCQTVEFHRLLHPVLRDTGFVALRVPSSQQYRGRELQALQQGVTATLRQVYPYVRVLPGERDIILAGTAPAPDISTVLSRFSDRAYRTSFVTPGILSRRWQDTPADGTVRDIPDGTNRDTHPRGIRSALAYWQALHHGSAPSWWWLAALPVCAIILVLAGAGRSGSQLPAAVSLLTSAAASMGIQLLLFMRYQTVAGTLFSHLALLTGLLMAGIIPGVLLARHMPGNRIPVPDAAMTVWIAVSGTVLLFAHRLPVSAYTITFSMLALGTGAVTGFQFNALVRRMHTDESARRTGTAYAADLAGACLAAVLFSGMLLPRYGMAACLGGMVVMKVGVMAAGLSAGTR